MRFRAALPVECLRPGGPERCGPDSTGDPWIYISWELQRREQDVRERYVELVVKPRERASQSELAITKSSRPLHMNRKFRMIPADLYIVPSAENFPLAPPPLPVLRVR
ncbi:unnamed protein product, partial [Prorocentrum cordatum]